MVRRPLCLAALLLLACDSESDSNSESDFTESKKFELLEGPELITCQVEKGSSSDPFFRQDVVSCALAPKADFPLQLKQALVAVRSLSKGSLGSVEVSSTEGTTVAKPFADQYPLELELVLSYSESEVTGLVGFDGSGFFKSFSVKHTIVAPTTEPLRERFPFDFWPVEVRASDVSFSGSLDTFKIDLAPMTTSGASTLEVKARLGTLSEGARKFSLIPVSRGTTRLSGTATLGDKQQAIELSGPGIYLAKSSGFGGATEEDLNDVSSGPRFLSCWTVPAAENAELHCRREPVPGLSFDSVDVVVDGTSVPVADGIEPTLVTSVPSSSLPIALSTRSRLQAPEGVVGLESRLDTPLELPFDLGSNANVDAPAGAYLPFDVWPVTVDAGEFSFLCDLDPYVVPMAVAWAGVSVLKVEGMSTPFLNQGDVSTFYIAADSRKQELTCKGLVITADGKTIENLPVSLARGGSYRVSEKGLEAAAP